MTSAALDKLLRERSWSRLPSEMNTVLVSDDQRYVVRMAPVDDFSPVNLDLTVTVALVLAEHDVPAIRLTAGVTQPAVVDGRAATVWDYVRPDPEPCSEAATLTTLALLHRVEDARLPLLDVRPALAQRLVRLRAEQPDRVTYWALLERWLNEAAEVWEGLEVSAVHGDLRACNVVAHQGVAVLADLDAVGRGQVVEITSHDLVVGLLDEVLDVPVLKQRPRVLGVIGLVEHEPVGIADVPDPQDEREDRNPDRADPAPCALREREDARHATEGLQTIQHD